MRAVTIIDIAKQAGVSVSTVSRVINDSKKVSDSLRQRVCEVIEKNNFRPNSIAQGLVTKTTHIVGIVLPDISNPVFYTLIKGIDAVLSQYEYTFILCESQGKSSKEAELLQLLRDRKIDGIIFAGVTVDEKLIATMNDIHIPIVLVCQDPERLDCGFDVVNIDNIKLAYDATQFLIQSGHERIAMLSGPLYDLGSGRKRFEGYCKALEDANIPFYENYVKFGPFLFEDGVRGMKQIFEENRKLPTAVLAASDLMAIGAIDFLISNGVEVPEQISVMGMTDIPMSAIYRPALTTMKFDAYEVGNTASHILMEILNGNGSSPAYHEIDFKLIRRNSVKIKV